MKQQWKVNHLGYLVKDINKSRAAFEGLGFTPRTPESIYDQDRACHILFMDNGVSCIELIRPKDETSPIFGLLKRYSNMPYHLCFESSDLAADIATLTYSGGGCTSFGRRKKARLYPPPPRWLFL